ncbi:MAG: lipoyl(octanoyl) transferase LipB [Chloroflexota bacterium]
MTTAGDARIAPTVPRAENATFAVRFLGRVEYLEALALQRSLAARRDAEEIGDTVLLLEHPPVITLGRRGSRDDVYASDQELARLGIPVIETNRGGLVTYHGPGQLVGYPIVRLRSFAGDAPRYVTLLEESIIRTLARLGVAAFRNPEHRGVFTARGKIAAIGVAVSRGVTMHGFALNVDPDLSHFDLINPCGIGELGVTSIRCETGATLGLREVGEMVAAELRACVGTN